METITDIVNEIIKIRDTLDGIEVKGKQNAALLCYAYDKCNALADVLMKIATEIQNESKNENIPVDGGEENGKQD